MWMGQNLSSETLHAVRLVKEIDAERDANFDAALGFEDIIWIAALHDACADAVVLLIRNCLPSVWRDTPGYYPLGQGGSLVRSRECAAALLSIDFDWETECFYALNSSRTQVQQINNLEAVAFGDEGHLPETFDPDVARRLLLPVVRQPLQRAA